MIEEIKKAVKEFAEKVKDRFKGKHSCYIYSDGYTSIGNEINEDIDELLKEYEELLDEFADCKTCSAWSGSDCTRNPYTEGCLKEETK